MVPKSLRRVAALATITLFVSSSAAAEITLLGSVSVPGDATDKSGLTDLLTDGTPHNRLGAHGSGIAYTGVGTRYLMASDRGPGDGAIPFHCRFHVVDIDVRSGRKPAVTVALSTTTLLKDEDGSPFVGLASAFNLEKPAASRRLDPEGIRVGRSGSVLISDEYGPYVYEFGRNGIRQRSLPVPEKFLIANPKDTEKEEAAQNKFGRLSNKGMEGLAITPDGRKLIGIMQSPLIQDGGHSALLVRILEFDVGSKSTREFLYQLDDASHGVSEILAINDRDFLVLERDGKAGNEAKCKKLFRIDIKGATDVSKFAALPKGQLPMDVAVVKKQLFLDMLVPRFGLAGPHFPKKIEGMAFGPDLHDGRHLLIVTTDNDLKRDEPTWIYAFALDATDLPGYQPQQFAK